MITKIEVFSPQPDAPELPLGGFTPNDDPVQLRNADGLGPVKAEITTSPLSGVRGEIKQGSNTGKRNIVLTLGLNPDWEGEQSVASLRHELYRYFMPEQWVKLRFFSQELPVVDIEGTVEGADPNIFSEDPEIICSVICEKPDFIEPDATIYTGVVDDGTAEFEFDYIGSVDTGFEFQIAHSLENPSYTGDLDLTLSQVADQILHMDDVTIDTGQYFRMSSVQGDKRVQIIDLVDGTPTNLMAQMSAASVWPRIKPGTNVLKVAAAETGQKWTMAFFNRFGGL